MKKTAAVFFYFAILLSKPSMAQTYLPSYREVAKEFFTNYSHEPEEYFDRIVFAKKKEGWFVDITDMSHDDSVKKEHLFWDIKEKKYQTLTGFGPGLSQEEAAKKVAEGLQSGSPFLLYSTERCRYYGYDLWDVDMIKDFGGSIPENDTLLEGLARAYAFYAERYLAYGFGGRPYDNDPLKSILNKLEKPNKERINQFMAYLNKAIDCYRVLTERNPGYMMLVGTAEIKLVNEQFHQYQQLNTFGYPKEAKEVLNSIKSNNIYRQIGYTYLAACPPNSILITNGDNDTYPLWYVQAKEGFRKDVTVLNYSLLGTVQYLDMLKKNKLVNFSTTSAFFEKLKFEYFYFDEGPGPAEISVALPTFIDDIQKEKYPYITLNDTLISYRTKTILWDINLARLKKICNQSNFVPVMDFELKHYMFLNDFAILDILNSNLYTRPVCVTVELSLFTKINMQREGSVYRILPLDESLPDSKTRIEIAKTGAFLSKNDKPVLVAYGRQLNQYQDIIHGVHSGMYADLINGYINLEKPAIAGQWAKRYLMHPDIKKISPEVNHISIAEALAAAGYKKEARLLIEKMAENLSANYGHYSALDYCQTKEDLLSVLEYLKYALDQKKITSDVLEKIIEDIKGKKD
jgi:hypothetical protein